MTEYAFIKGYGECHRILDLTIGPKFWEEEAIRIDKKERAKGGKLIYTVDEVAKELGATKEEITKLLNEHYKEAKKTGRGEEATAQNRNTCY